jgi:hypothetical protein
MDIIKSLADIPNQDGFCFIGICKDGSEIKCEVGKVNRGFTVFREDDGAFAFHLLKGWRYCTESDE